MLAEACTWLDTTFTYVNTPEVLTTDSFFQNVAKTENSPLNHAKNPDVDWRSAQWILTASFCADYSVAPHTTRTAGLDKIARGRLFA